MITRACVHSIGGINPQKLFLHFLIYKRINLRINNISNKEYQIGLLLYNQINIFCQIASINQIAQMQIAYHYNFHRRDIACAFVDGDFLLCYHRISKSVVSHIHNGGNRQSSDSKEDGSRSARIVIEIIA